MAEGWSYNVRSLYAVRMPAAGAPVGQAFTGSNATNPFNGAETSANNSDVQMPMPRAGRVVAFGGKGTPATDGNMTLKVANRTTLVSSAGTVTWAANTAEATKETPDAFAFAAGDELVLLFSNAGAANATIKMGFFVVEWSAL